MLGLLAQADTGVDALAPVFGVLTGIVVTFGPLAIGVTKLVDGLRLLVDRTPETPWPGWVWISCSMVLSIITAVLFEVNVADALIKTVPAFNQTTALEGTWGMIVTGIGMGGMASYWHETMALKAAKTAESKANAGV